MTQKPELGTCRTNKNKHPMLPECDGWQALPPSPQQVSGRREEMQDELRDKEEMRLQAEKLGHYPVDDGYCACGFLCETGTRFDRHIKAVLERGSQGGSRTK